ncbi:Ig-like domain-containing protein [Subtercola boreus]|uniref:Ig-like domain-containing protein n=1 Tax=Subtercola boreus TaxID=120213 RepID=UPI0011C04ABE|nr:cadherin-like domain-containing protein [Subtercola boreus]
MLRHRTPVLATAACAALLLAAPVIFSTSAALALPGDRTYYDVQEYAGPTLAGAGTSVSISGDGRYTVFDSVEKLTFDAVGDQKHVYRRSTADGSLQLVSTHSRTDGADGASFGASVSADGRFVAFVTTDRNVLPDDPGGARQVVLKDLDTGAVAWVSSRRSSADADREAVRDGSNSSAVVSADGQHVAFISSVPGVNNVGGPTTGVGNVEIYDVGSGDTTNVTSGITDAGTLVAAHGSSAQPAMSADGRFVVFTSDADNIGVAATTPPPTATPGARLSHVYRLDRTTGTKKLVDVSTADTLADLTKTDRSSSLPTVSSDGNVVGFISDATNLVPDGDMPKTTHLSDAYLRDMSTGQTHRVSLMLNDIAAPDHADSTGVMPSTMRTRYWREAVGGASRIAVSADGQSAVLTSISPLVWIDGECRSCQKFTDDNDALDVYRVTLGADGRPEDMQPISVRRNTQDWTTDAKAMPFTTLSNTGEGDSIADGATPVTADGRTVVFGSLADNLRGWDDYQLVLAGDMTFAKQKPVDIFGTPGDPREGLLLNVPHYLDGGFPGSTEPRVRMFLTNTNAFDIRLLVPAATTESLRLNPGARFDYETRHSTLPALTEQPAVATASSFIAPGAIQPGATGVVHGLSVTAKTAGSAVVTLSFDRFDLESEASVPTGWKRAKDDVLHTLTYTNTHFSAGDTANFSLHLKQNDADRAATAAVLADVNGASTAASADVRPAAPTCGVPPARQVVVAGLATVVRNAQCLAPGLPLSVTADHGAVSISPVGVTSYTPDAAYRGDSTITVVATDAAGRRSLPTTIAVTVGAPATSVDDHYRTAPGAVLTVDADHGLLSNDVFPTFTSPWRINEGYPPAHGTVVINDDTGAFTFTPEPGYTGPATFRYQTQARDAGVSTTGTVTIDVQ